MLIEKKKIVCGMIVCGVFLPYYNEKSFQLLTKIKWRIKYK